MTVHQQKERIRGPNLAGFAIYKEGVPMEETLRRVDEAGLVIPSNKRLSKALVGSDEWESLSKIFACWSGTMTAYDKPDQKLGKMIEYVDSETGVRYVFPVPEEHQGKKNVILLTEHPNFRLEVDGKNRIVLATTVELVDNFPTAKEGYYLGDKKYDIPTGVSVSSGNEAARYLWRTDKRVGLIARGGDDYGDYDDWVSVNLHYRPSSRFGVAVEAKEGAVPLETLGLQLTILRTADGEFIVRGSKEQVHTSAKLIEWVVQK